MQKVSKILYVPSYRTTDLETLQSGAVIPYYQVSPLDYTRIKLENGN